MYLPGISTPEHPAQRAAQRGYTLLELLLYVTILSALLTTVVFFFGTVTDARVKNQTVLEVNDQGTMLMDYLTQTIRTATSITAPAAGLAGPSLMLTVPTGSLSPTTFNLSGTTLGYGVDAGTNDTSDSGYINATKFVASSTGTISTLYMLTGNTIAASPNNKGQMAIYSGAVSPSALLTSSASTTLSASSWNAFAVPPVNVSSGQTYWLAYNTNGLAVADNALRQHAGTTNQSMFVAQAFGTWPASWTGTSQTLEYSLYAQIDRTAAPATLQIKEGATALLALTSSKVRLSGLTFKNLSRGGTLGIVQISFTLSRVNPSNVNAYEYQKTFTTSAELAW